MTTRRLWDSSVTIGYLAGYQEIYETCSQIIQQAERGETEIVISQMAIAETAYIGNLPDDESEQVIREFFSREYITPVNVNSPISAAAQGLVRKYRHTNRIRPPDAIHLATAMYLNLTVLETTDGRLINFDRREGAPPVTVRRPLYDGQHLLV